METKPLQTNRQREAWNEKMFSQSRARRRRRLLQLPASKLTSVASDSGDREIFFFVSRHGFKWSRKVSPLEKLANGNFFQWTFNAWWLKHFFIFVVCKEWINHPYSNRGLFHISKCILMCWNWLFKDWALKWQWTMDEVQCLIGVKRGDN